MKYIVTGAAGLIGGAIVRELNSRGISDILLVDHLGTTEKWQNLRELTYSDYLEKDLFRKLTAENKLDLSDLKYILHLGACSSTTEYDASYLADNNFNATKEMALLAQKSGAYMIYASSAATYGDGSHGYVDDEEHMNELKPLNMYGYSKLMFDLWARRQGFLRKNLCGVKFTNVFGPNEKHKGNMRSMILRSFEQITAGGKVELFKSDRPDFKDGEQKRDFIYVKDAANMVLGLMEKKATGIYNIGSGRAETWNELVKAVFESLNKPVNIEYIDMPEKLRGKYQYYTCADMTKFHRLLPELSARPLNETIKDYVINHLVPGVNE